MTQTNELVYAVIYERRYGQLETTIPDGADLDIEGAISWAEEVADDLVEIVTHVLNPNDYWRGYFYWNDSEDPSEACPIEFNSREHLDAYWETNNSGGHHDCTYYEHIVNGTIIERIEQQDND